MVHSDRQFLGLFSGFLMVHATAMTSKNWSHASHVAALALLCSACQHPSDSLASKPVAPSPQPAGARGDREPVAAAGPHSVGALAPAMTLHTLDGQTIDLAKLYGTKPVYLKFWATWCVPCREQTPRFKRIYDAMGDRMHVIAVNDGVNDDEAAVRAFREQYGLRMPIAIDDGKLAAALDLRVTVQHVVIGRDARLVYVDYRDGAELDQALEKVLSEPAPSGPTTGRQVAIRPAFRPGDLVQGLVATALDGTAVPVGRSRDGRPRALMLFSTWFESYVATSRPQASQACRRVREEVDRLVATGGIEWLGIAGGAWQTMEDLTEYRSTTNTKLPLALDADGSVFAAFGVRQVPMIALLDRDGRLVRMLGPDERDLAEAVRALGAK
jgi:peroxiredoxin